MTRRTRDDSLSVTLPALDDGARLAELSRTGVDDGRADGVFDRFARLAAVMLDAPVFYVSLVGHDRQTMPGAVWLDRDGEDGRETALQHSVCAFSIATGDQTVIEDMSADPLVRSNPQMQALDFCSYAGYPLTTEDGHVLGNLCVLDRVPRRWTEDELGLLRDLASLVLQELQHRITRARLSALRDEVAGVLAEVPPAKQALRLLVDAAGRSDEPRLHRTAATADARFERLARAAGAVRDDLDDQPDDELQDVSVASTTRRAVSGTRAVTGSNVRLEVAPDAEHARLRCDAFGLERALSHLLVTVLHHSDQAVPLARLEVEHGALRLVLGAAGARVPAAELGTAVARLDAAVSPGSRREEGRRATVRMSGGRVSANAGHVAGQVSSDGVTVTGHWRL